MLYGRILLLLVVAVFSVARFYQPSQPLSGPAVFKDFAHILVGLLLGLTVADKGHRWFWGLVLAAFTLVEVVAFWQLHQ